VHDGSLEDVTLQDVALAVEVHVPESLLWAPIHVLEMESKRLLNALCEMVLAVALLEFLSVTVAFSADVTRGCL